MPDETPGFFTAYRVAILGLGLMGGSLAMALPGKCSILTGGLPRCIRVLLHWNTNLPQPVVRHVVLEEAVRLHPGLINTTQEVPL
jgi:hypothetical protein